MVLQSQRRDRFRQFMENLSATGSPPANGLSKFYVPRPGISIGQKIAKRVELQPAFSHLVVGGVGTGKSTQVILAQQLINEGPDARALYVDVSQEHDLAQLQAGVLTVIAGLAITRHLEQEGHTLDRNARQFQRWAKGYTEWYSSDDDPDFEPDFEPPNERLTAVTVKPVIVPPEPPLTPKLKSHADALKLLVEMAVGIESKQFVVVFDSLDRLVNMSVFDAVVSEDIRAIRQCGVGVVAVGPLPVVFGSNRVIADRFDYLDQVPAVDFSSRAEADFLRDVIWSRVPREMVDAEALSALIRSSGGVLRDLILLAKAAAEESYVSGADSIGMQQVATAADAFGRRLMLGLDEDDLEILRRVKKRKQFVQTSDREVALLVTRRILEYGAGLPTYAVHPTIAPLL